MRRRPPSRAASPRAMLPWRTPPPSGRVRKHDPVSLALATASPAGRGIDQLVADVPEAGERGEGEGDEGGLRPG